MTLPVAKAQEFRLGFAPNSPKKNLEFCPCKKKKIMEGKELKELLDALAAKIAEHLETIWEAKRKPEESTGEEWFTTEQVCERLHITKATLYRHRNMGFITPARYVGRKPLFNQESINNYLNNFTNE